MKNENAITFLFVTCLAFSIMLFFIIKSLEEKQCQIDQACQAVFTLAREQGATDKTSFNSGASKKEYCIFFADYSRNMALLGEFDGDISCDKKPRLIIMHNIDEKNLKYWSNQPVLYEKYRKIPR